MTPMETWLLASPGSQATHIHRSGERPERDHPDLPGNVNVNFTAGVGTASITVVKAQSTTLTATQG